MRSVLVDHARRRGAQKRGCGARRVSLDEVVSLFERNALDLIALDDALERLSERDPGLSRLIDLRFFGGLTEEETATILQVSTRTVRREWRFAKMWLRCEIEGRPHHD